VSSAIIYIAIAVCIIVVFLALTSRYGSDA